MLTILSFPQFTMWLTSSGPLCQNRHDIVAEELTFAAEEGGDHLVGRNPDADGGKYDHIYHRTKSIYVRRPN